VAGYLLLLLVLCGLVVLWSAPVRAANISLTICDEASLQQAIINANKGDTITFNCGNNAVIDLNQVITIEKDLTIDGNRQQITLDGQHKTGIFQINSGVVFIIKDLILTNSQSLVNGAIVNNGTLLVIHSTFSGNNVDHEGGTISNYGTLTVTNSIFSSNSVTSDGAGGIYNYSGTLNISDSTFSSNTANYGNASAGGIFTLGGTLTVTNSTFSDNTANSKHGSSGGILNQGGTLTVTNSSFSGNKATHSGGILNQGGTLTVTNASFTNNISNSSGGGGIFNASGIVKLKNTIVSINSTNNCSGSITDQGYNLEYSSGNSNTCGFSNHAVSGDPLLTALIDNGGPTRTLALLPGSPAIGHGYCNDGDTDQRGVLRQLPCSIGAYEYRAKTTLSTCNEPSLDTALTFASPGATLLFGCSGTITLTVTDGNALTINKSLTLDGDGKQVILTAAGRGRVIKVASGITLKLNNLTISGGNAGRFSADYPACNGGGGGGICNLGSTVIITNSTISGNSSRNGGGILSLGGNLTINNSTISNNLAFNGVGEACCGGGIASLGGSLTVTNSTFFNNSGGGIANSNGVLTVTTSTFTGNTAVLGSAISHLGNETATLTGNLIAGNRPLYSASSNYDLNGNFSSGGYNLVGNGDNSYGLVNGVNKDQVGTTYSPINPLVGPLADNGGPTLTIPLLPSSPALDTIPASVSFCGGSDDQRGVSRPQGDSCDIGAFEQLPPTVSLDNFNRPDGPLGQNWIGNTALGFYKIVTNEVAVGNSGYIYWSTELGSNQEVAYTFTRIATNATEHDLLLKGDGGNPMLGTAHLVEVQYNPTRKEVRINTQAPGRGWYTHIRFTQVNFVAGDRFRAKAYSSGLVEVYQNEKFIGSFNVTTGAKAWPKAYATAGGYSGVWFIGTFLTNTARFDNFGGGNF
jgi:hypothetical protein